MNTTTRVNRRTTERNVGIDVGKSLLDIYIHELDLYWQEDNTPGGIKTLIKVLRRYKLTRIVVEATGGYERLLAEMLSEKEMPVIVVQPIQVRQFAKAQGISAKTDKLDAKVIAQFGIVMKPEIRPLASKKIRLIRDLLARDRQLNEARTQELNRRHKAQKPLQASHDRLLRCLEKEIGWVRGSWIKPFQKSLSGSVLISC